LLRWKDSLGNQSILQSWVAPANANSSTLSPCQWRGITCDDAGNVTQINLPNVGLTGTLQYLDFSSLTNLLRLDLRENQLTGTIPSSIGTLYKLQYLDLATNFLYGTCHGVNFSLSKTDIARQSSPARLSLSLTDSLVFCLRLVCPTNPRNPHTLSMPQASGITQLNRNRINTAAIYRNKSQPFH
jgi:hypothetical protein